MSRREVMAVGFALISIGVGSLLARLAGAPKLGVLISVCLWLAYLAGRASEGEA